VGLAQALLHDPPVLILDEPTTGLDPHQIIEIRDLIRRIGTEKATVLSTHIMQEASAVATRILIIQEGRIIADGTADDLRRQAGGGQSFRGRIQGPEASIADKLRAISGLSDIHVRAAGDGWSAFSFRAGGDADAGAEVFRMARDNNWTLAEVGSTDLSLEDVYLRLTKS
ncbi:MAG: hypothetical protein JXP34_23305, partial [Planctomycetes bacterium]|nr:hypothetical protein [Planctomycetota bacterium]